MQNAIYISKIICYFEFLKIKSFKILVISKVWIFGFSDDIFGWESGQHSEEVGVMGGWQVGRGVEGGNSTPDIVWSTDDITHYAQKTRYTPQSQGDITHSYQGRWVLAN